MRIYSGGSHKGVGRKKITHAHLLGHHRIGYIQRLRGFQLHHFRISNRSISIGPINPLAGVSCVLQIGYNLVDI